MGDHPANLILIPGRNQPENTGVYQRIRQWAQAEMQIAVTIVDIPHAESPRYADYVDAFSRLSFTKRTVVFARSMGARGILKYIANNSTVVDSLILQSPATDASPALAEYLANKLELTSQITAKVAKQVNYIAINYSDNDEFARSSPKPFTDLAKDLAAETFLESGKGHFYRVVYERESDLMWRILRKRLGHVCGL